MIDIEVTISQMEEDMKNSKPLLSSVHACNVEVLVVNIECCNIIKMRV